MSKGTTISGYVPIRNGMDVPPIGKNQFLSSTIRRLLKALANPIVLPQSLGASVMLTDGNWALDLGKLVESGGGGGGTGSVQQFIIDNNAGVAAIYADYIRCVPWNGAITGPAAYVAKPSYLRHSLWPSKTFYDATNTLRTVTYTYSFVNNYGPTRTAAISGLSASQIEAVLERYRAGDLIYAMSVDHTGVNDPNGNEITLLDTNVDARRWVRFYGQ